ncbi:MAG TPA: hypothetical protein VE944_16255 [Nostoc sp.]|uniref:hypothetical protein n=1 Tax=Nostoc sp. TaxID=1180 RepID=UPI002D56EE54|nr:hypothetical protein [Nostoc sp.]HYX15883.1 hypothetical protein [Nostoc sp.]
MELPLVFIIPKNRAGVASNQDWNNIGQEAQRYTVMNQRKSKVIVSAASRRSFLLHTGIFTASSIVTGTVGLKFSAQKGQAQEQVSSAKNKFTEKAYRIRVASAEANRQIPIASNPTNGDEERYPNKIGSDTRGLSCYVYNLHYQGGQDAHPTIILKKY